MALNMLQLAFINQMLLIMQLEGQLYFLLKHKAMKRKLFGRHMLQNLNTAIISFR